MKRKTWYWIIGLSVVGLLVCGGFVGLGLWVADQYGGGGDLGLAFGEGIAIVPEANRVYLAYSGASEWERGCASSMK